MEEYEEREEYTLVARKPCFGLPTACPVCFPVFIYLKLARFPFRLDFNSTYPDSDQIPYLESGAYVAYNNENGGVIERLKQDGVVNLDAEFCSVPEWISMKAMINSWLLDAIMYDLWLGSDRSSAFKIYYSDLPWVIGKALFVKQEFAVKQRLGISKENAERREEEIYRKAKIAYGALSTTLGEREFLFEDRPSSLDAFFLGHVLFTIQGLPLNIEGAALRRHSRKSYHARDWEKWKKISDRETSVLRSSLLEHGNLVRYAEKHKTDLLESGPSSSSIPWFHPEPSSSTPRRGPPNSNAKPKRKPKREKTEEEKTFKRRAKYFLVAQGIAILLFLSVMGGYDFSEVEAGDDEGYDYD